MGADLYPTIVEMVGRGAQPGQNLDGNSLVPILLGKDEWGRQELFWYYPHYPPVTRQPGAAVRSGDFKLIKQYDPPRVELYNLAEDIGEQFDLAMKIPEKVLNLENKLENWLNEKGFILHKLNPDYDPEWRAKSPLPNEPWNKVFDK